MTLSDMLERLAERLRQHPQLCWRRDPQLGGIEIDAPNEGGFPVSLFQVDEDEWAVGYGSGGGHYHFEAGADAEDIMSFVAFALSDRCRLREVWRGNTIQKSMLEVRDGDGWRRLDMSALLFVPFWCARRERTLQNYYFRYSGASTPPAL